MTAEHFRSDFKHKQTSAKDLDGYFGSRVSVTEGTNPPSRSRPVQNPEAGNVHRSSVQEYVPHDTNHEPYTTAHRPPVEPQTPTSPVDLGGLRKNQESMISDRQKKKNKRKTDV